MTEPTKDEYQRVLDFISYALEHANEVTLQHDAQILVERALIVAANLPSLEELTGLVEYYVCDETRSTPLARRIFERIKGGK